MSHLGLSGAFPTVVSSVLVCSQADVCSVVSFTGVTVPMGNQGLSLFLWDREALRFLGHRALVPLGLWRGARQSSSLRAE